jgi:hypothetical protein
VSKFLIQVDLRLIKNLIVEAETEEEAIEAAATISAEALALGESDNEDVQVLGDEPVGHGSGGVYLLALEGTPEWEHEFGKEITQ